MRNKVVKLMAELGLVLFNTGFLWNFRFLMFVVHAKVLKD